MKKLTFKKFILNENKKVKFVDKNHVLYEGMNFSTGLGNAVSMLRYWGPRKFTTTFGHRSSKKLEITIDEKEDSLMVDIFWFEGENLECLIRNSENLGYYISEIEFKEKGRGYFLYLEYNRELLEEFLNKKDQLDGLIVILKAKYDIEVFSKRIPDALYYVCQKNDLSKILETGLISRNELEPSVPPNKIYFGFSIGDALKIGKYFYNEISKEIINEYALLEIETEKIEHFRMFEDPDFKGYGVYILVNVHPDAITVLKENIKL